MRTLYSEKGKLIIEIDAIERSQIAGLFSIISSTDKPNWWATEDGTADPILDEERFEALWDAWLALTKSPQAGAFFSGKR